MTITRRTALATLAASPFTVAPVATQAAVSPEGHTKLEENYLDWLSAKAEIDDALNALPRQLTKSMEKDILFPLYERSDALEDEIVASPVTGPRDLAVKVLVALATPEALSDDAIERVKSDALNMARPLRTA